MNDVRFPSISAIEFLLLDLLGQRERYGLQLVDASAGKVKLGTVYVTLARMEAKGFVESRQEERQAGATGMPRRLYRATDYGLKVYEAYGLLREALALKPVEAQ